MEGNYILISLVILWAIAYGVIAVVLFLRRGFKETLVQALVFYSLSAAVFALLQGISLISGLEQGIYRLLRLIANYGSLGLILILVFCSFELLAMKARRKIWFTLSGVIFRICTITCRANCISLDTAG
jgi:hypothetical protein